MLDIYDNVESALRWLHNARSVRKFNSRLSD